MEPNDARAVVAALCADLTTGTRPDVESSLTQELSEHGDCSRVLHHLMYRDEHLDRAVADAYRIVLAREADGDELRSHKTAIRSGGVWISDLPLVLLEQVAREHDGSFETYLALMYDIALGREVTVFEVEHWLEQSKGRSLISLAKEIWSGPEASTHRIAEIYRCHLWRDPDPSGIATWKKVLQSVGDEPVRAGLVSSLEYLLLARARSEKSPPVATRLRSPDRANGTSPAPLRAG